MNQVVEPSMFGLGPPNRQVTLHTWIYTASPPLIVSRTGLSNVGTSIIIIQITGQEVDAAANAAVGYSWPAATEGVRPHM